MPKVFVVSREKISKEGVDGRHPCLSSLASVLLAAQAEAAQLPRKEKLSMKDFAAIQGGIDEALSRTVKLLFKAALVE